MTMNAIRNAPTQTRQAQMKQIQIRRLASPSDDCGPVTETLVVTAVACIGGNTTTHLVWTSRLYALPRHFRSPLRDASDRRPGGSGRIPWPARPSASILLPRSDWTT